MSQDNHPKPVKTEFDDALKGIYGDKDQQDIDAAEGYQSVNPLTVSCFLLGIASLTCFLHWGAVLIPLIALVVGGLALRRILKAREITTGLSLTYAGMIMAVVFGIGGYSYVRYTYYTQAPAGYEQVDWKDLVAETKPFRLPQLAEDLDGHRIFVRGYMYPDRFRENIKRFKLCRTVEHCEFCKPIPNPTDAIYVKFVDGSAVNFTSRMVGVGGKFLINPGDPNDEIPEDAAYYIEADCFR